jgi:hypothetical protein
MTNHLTPRPGPERIAKVLLLAGILAASYLDYFGYRAQGYYAAGFWEDRLHGLATAPDQYRIGIVWLSHWMMLHLHLPLMWSLASIDLLSGLVAVLVLFSVFVHSMVYRDATHAGRWFGCASFVLLILWFLAWLLWLQKPETMPAVMLISILLWLWQLRDVSSSWLLRASLIVTVSLLLSTFRADMACLLNLGILIFVLARKSSLALPRPAVIVVTGVSTLAAAAIQLYLMRVAFPHAGYGLVKLWQFWPNLKHATRWPPFVLFLLPLFWMLIQVVRRRFHRDAAGLAFLAGALCFAALWITIGKIDEVRIFIPFAMALTPLTAQMAMLQAGDSGPAPEAKL